MHTNVSFFVDQGGKQSNEVGHGLIPTKNEQKFIVRRAKKKIKYRIFATFEYMAADKNPRKISAKILELLES